MNWLFSPPTLDDLIRLLKAWRFWVLGALVGALLGTAFYVIAPPPYRARATVNVDFNLEEAWPQDIDRQQFYYLERETRKLEEVAWSDVVLQVVADKDQGLTVRELRDEKLSLAQPREAGWHFIADDRDPQRAAVLASAWAQAFAERVEAEVDVQAGLNSFIRVDATQTVQLPVERSVPLSAYLFTGSVSILFIGVFVVLFFDFGQKSRVGQ